MLAGFSRHRLTDALQFVKKNADYSLERLDDGCQRQKLHITGVFYSQKFASAVETELSLRSAAARPVAVSSQSSNLSILAATLSLSLSLSLALALALVVVIVEELVVVLLPATSYAHMCEILNKTKLNWTYFFSVLLLGRHLRPVNILLRQLLPNILLLHPCST